MNTLTTFAFLLTLSLAHSEPIITKDNVLIITEECFPESFVVYTGQHDIVKIFTPINSLNFDDSDDEGEDDNLYVFFVEGDRDSEGNTEYKGLYALKNEQASKILDNGRDITASNDDSKQVFFAASDGIYVYNAEKNTADKYGTVDEDIVGIAKANVTDLIYILTSSNEVYKVTEEGTVKEKLDKIKNAKQIVLDSSDNLYYVDNKQVYVYSDGEVTKIKGLPNNPSYLQLVRPAFVMQDTIPLVVGKKGYIAHANGTTEYKKLLFNIYPTAYSMEATLINFYGHNKKIYFYNILEMVSKDEIDIGVHSYFDEKKEEIQSIATRSRKSFHA